jgi:hypothetical protein
VEANLKPSKPPPRTCLELLEGPLAEETLLVLSGILNEFGRIARGVLMLGERPPRSVDEAIAVGERLSSTADRRLPALAQRRCLRGQRQAT